MSVSRFATAAVVALLAVPPTVEAQANRTISLLTTVGKDTLCFEQYTRIGDVVTGSWVVMHPPGVFVHDYRIVLDRDGIPTRYEMKYSEPLSATPPALQSMSIDYGRDTATYVMTLRDSVVTQKVALHEAFPLLGQSFVGLDLAMQRVRRGHMDTATVVLNAPTQPTVPAVKLAIHFFGDSATVGPAMHAHVGPDGSLVDMSTGPFTVHHLASLDVAQLTKHFVDAYAPRMAALNAEAAARVEVQLQGSQLDKFVGDYKLAGTPQTLTIARDGEHLVLTAPGAAKRTLLASSQTEFFIRKPYLVVSFDVNASGSATGMTLVQGETRQKLVRLK